jgi:hypothetical protein
MHTIMALHQRRGFDLRVLITDISSELTLAGSVDILQLHLPAALQFHFPWFGQMLQNTAHLWLHCIYIHILQLVQQSTG